MRKQSLSLAAIAAGAALALSACGGVSTSTGGDDGGEYPSGAVEMYVGADPGGSSDLISRQVATGLTDELGETFSVINRSGSNGALAAAEVEQAEPNGDIIAIQNASLFAITPLAVAEEEVTDINDFDVVGGVSRDDYVLVTSADNDWATIDDLKSAGKKVTYGTTGVGTGSQLSCGLTYSTAGIDSEAVPFDGGAPALTALLGNQVDTACLQVGEARENIESGKITPLSVYAPERIDALPDVPTATEQGIDVEVYQYRFMTTPKGTPQDVKDAIWEGMQATFETEDYQAFNEANSLTPMEVPGDEVVEALESDKQRYADLVEQYDINLAE
ncbi:tripartite tricarboxylate transporter substrate binding protein [Nocardioides cavernae]|uniref:Tripartite tricarboxylate transporter substrate binding protein n=1 Tax=Nocardioides cavernae TaxID=1921566 RepID=A0ABR8N611_9ACTN|nr:tripartite tricarboxylate transporter substrate binding protein [Nocardioides cavernae]MBD3923588.1 tripartite tricarboxylate transporter substrate binding protein [Nocardioides cavernae]MBM7511483.1 tripartite-type tricarboxylate transporter receptor subunit TctC [Nocardioides cavernae]